MSPTAPAKPHNWRETFCLAARRHLRCAAGVPHEDTAGFSVGYTNLQPHGRPTTRLRADILSEYTSQRCRKNRGAAVKVCMFHLMPYRDLPADFEQRYHSAYVDPLWFDVADADKVGQYYNATLDELIYAAKAGFHGVCTNQHHQNAYGFMANPSLMGSVLARQPTARTSPSSSSARPPVDHAADPHRRGICDARLHQRRAAGRRLPDRSPTDATFERRPPIEQRERYREALELVTRPGRPRNVRLERQALSARHGQPLAAADPAAASANLDSWRRAFRQPPTMLSSHDHCFCHLSYYGAKNAERGERPLLGAGRARRDATTTRTGTAFCSSIGVADTDAEAEELYAPHAEYFFHKLLYTPHLLPADPGLPRISAAMVQALHGTIRGPRSICASSRPKIFSIAALSLSAARRPCASKLLDGVKRLRIGHLL